MSTKHSKWASRSVPWPCLPMLPSCSITSLDARWGHLTRRQPGLAEAAIVRAPCFLLGVAGIGRSGTYIGIHRPHYLNGPTRQKECWAVQRADVEDQGLLQKVELAGCIPLHPTTCCCCRSTIFRICRITGSIWKNTFCRNAGKNRAGRSTPARKGRSTSNVNACDRHGAGRGCKQVPQSLWQPFRSLHSTPSLAAISERQAIVSAGSAFAEPHDCSAAACCSSRSAGQTGLREGGGRRRYRRRQIWRSRRRLGGPGVAARFGRPTWNNSLRWRWCSPRRMRQQ